MNHQRNASGNCSISGCPCGGAPAAAAEDNDNEGFNGHCPTCGQADYVRNRRERELILAALKIYHSDALTGNPSLDVFTEAEVDTMIKRFSLEN